MAITTLSSLISAKRHPVVFNNTASTGNSAITSRFNSTGEPSGTLAGTSTAAGVVPVGGTAGYPFIEPFDGSNHGYLGNLLATNSVISRLVIFDRLFVAGAYAFNANVTLASQPSYASRVPDSNYSGLELWVEVVTAITGTLTISVGYTNQAGTNSRSTGAVSFGATRPANSCFPFPLQSGDDGIQQVNSVTSTVSTAGTFNIMVLRRLGEINITSANSYGRVSVMDGDFLPRVYADSALYLLTYNTVGGTGIVNLKADILEG